MMYKFKRWFRNWLEQGEIVQEGNLLKVSSDQLDSDRCLHLRIWFAQGGKVLQTNSYDRKNDRSNQSLYVLTEDQKLGDEIDKIVMLEAMKL